MHPTDADLRALLDETLDDARVVDCTKHIETCPACLDRLAALTASRPFAWAIPDEGLPVPTRAANTGSPLGRGVGDSSRPLPQVPTRLVIEGFELHEELGRGGHGVVYRATQRSLRRTVAIKLLKRGGLASLDETRRFITESLTVAQLHHPGIVAIHDSGSTGLDEFDGLPWFAMELMRGGTLLDRCAGRAIPPHAAARLVERLAQAVAAAHEVGVIHRDLKPANVLFANPPPDRSPPTDESLPPNPDRPDDRLEDRVPWSDTDIVKIADFGLAKQIDLPEGPTPSMSILGTPAYMAPEMTSGATKQATAQVDVYGLGAILYELLTGQPPFCGATPFDVLMKARHHEPLRPRRLQPSIPRALEVICLKCLEKEPEARYEGVLALADDLRRFLAAEPIRARPVGIGRRWYRWHIQHRAVSRLLLGMGATLLVLAWLGWRQFESRGTSGASAAQLVLRARAVDLQATLAQARASAKGTLEPQLHEAFRASADPRDKVRAACLVEKPTPEELHYLVSALPTIDRDECVPVVAGLRRAVESSPQHVIEPLRELLREGQAVPRLLLTLAYLGVEQPVLERLVVPEDPGMRTAFIDEVPRWWPGAEALETILPTTASGEIRSALCCGVAKCESEELRPGELKVLTDALSRQCVEAPDGGTHSAAKAALRHFRVSLPAVAQRNSAAAGREWFVSPSAQTLVWIPPGEFTMGMRPESFGSGIQPASVAHRVTIPGGFWMATTEVHRELFERFIDTETKPELEVLYRGAWNARWDIDDERISPTGAHPMQKVRWFEALAFCNWLSQREGRRPAYYRFDRAERIGEGATLPETLRGYWLDPEADGYRLPTEEQWEYACRAGAVSDYFHGDQVEGDTAKIRPDYAQIGSRSTLPVGSLLPNRFGLFDMHGNLCEWCWNGDRVYSPEPYVAQVPRISGQTVAHRGGSWSLGTRWAIAGYRGQTDRNHDRDPNMGFRVICPPQREGTDTASGPRAERGFVYHDFDGDGTYDPLDDDLPLQGLRVFVDFNDDGVRTDDEPVVVTDERGEFEFAGLPVGEHRVRCESRAPWIILEAGRPRGAAGQSAPRANEAQPGLTQGAWMRVTEDGRVESAWFRAFTGEVVVGNVYVDRNRNRIRDADEPGVAGAVLTVRGPYDDVGTVTTGSDGRIRLWRLPGIQQAELELPDGYRWLDRKNKWPKVDVYSQPHPELNFPVREVDAE